MAFTLVKGYTWADGEIETAVKLNLAGVPTIADGQTYTFGAGAAATPSINFTGATTTGFYLGTTAIGISIGAVSIGTIGIVNGFNLNGTENTTKILLFNTTPSTGKNWSLISADGGNFVLSHSGVVNAWIVSPTTGATSFAQDVTVGRDLIITNLAAVCTANVVKTADTALVDLTGMTITVTAAGVYMFKAAILMSTTTTGGFRTTLDGTATMTSMRVQNVMTFGGAGVAAVVAASTISTLGSGMTIASTGTNATGLSMFEGSFTVNAAGTVKIQVAQNNAAGVTTFYANSNLWAQRIS